jgi:hypothetical protein
MSPFDPPPQDYSPELLADMEEVYTSVWKLMQPRVLTRNEQTTGELEIRLAELWWS